jgi:hypothetical protein
MQESGRCGTTKTPKSLTRNSSEARLWLVRRQNVIARSNQFKKRSQYRHPILRGRSAWLHPVF